MSEIELSAGTIEYTDTGGAGPVIVLLHGLLMDASLWDERDRRPVRRSPVPRADPPAGRAPHRCAPGADLSLPGIAALVAEFLDRLGLQDVTLVGNDTGGALVQLLMRRGRRRRVAQVVLVSCDAFDNFPPGLTGQTLALAGKLPPALFGLFMQQLRLRPVRRLPLAFGWLTRRGDAATARWLRPVLTQPAIRRDTVRMLRAVAADKPPPGDAAGRLPAFDRPALVVWAARTASCRPSTAPAGRRSPAGRLVEVDDSYTLIPLDQPAALARLIREFARAASRA